MKIGILSHLGFKQMHGGNLRAYFLIQELIKRKHDVKVILSSQRDVADPIEKFDCEVIKIGCSISRWDSLASKKFSFLDFIFRTTVFLKKSDLDVAFGICLVQALPIVLQRKCRSAILYVDIWSDFYAYDQQGQLSSPLISKTMRLLEKWTVRRADRVSFITDTMQQMLRVNGKRETFIIPDGVDTKLFKPGIDPSPIREKYKIREDQPVIGYQGGIKRHEGLQLLASTAPFIIKKIPEVQFLITGKGDYLEKVKRITQRNNSASHFIFTGWVDYFQMPQILAANTISVVPMPDVPAGQPIISFKLLENLASCVPIVVNDLPGVREVVNEECVRFTRADDPIRFTKDIVELLTMKRDALNKMTALGRKLAELLDWRKIAKLDADFIEGKQVNAKLSLGLF